jgi:hypothetical protein
VIIGERTGLLNASSLLIQPRLQAAQTCLVFSPNGFFSHLYSVLASTCRVWMTFSSAGRTFRSQSGSRCSWLLAREPQNKQARPPLSFLASTSSRLKPARGAQPLKPVFKIGV